MNIAICMTCRFRAKAWTVPGYPVCTKDGIGVDQHARDDACPMDFYRNPPQPTSDNSQSCLHRGRAIRQVECPTCSGKVMVKVFSCPIHAECALGDKIAEVQHCRACPDRIAPSEQSGDAKHL